MKTRETKTYKVRLIVGAVVVVVAGAGTAAVINRMTVKTSDATVSMQAPQPQSGTILYVGTKGKTALTQLKETASNVTTKTSSYGEYVDSIGNLIGGTDGKYWSFYVDDKLASVGAGAYVSTGGEKIEWKFEKLQ